MSAGIDAQWVLSIRTDNKGWQEFYKSKPGSLTIMSAAPCHAHSAKVFIYPDPDPFYRAEEADFWAWIEECLLSSWKSWQDIYDRFHQEDEKPRPMPTIEQIKAAYYSGGGVL